MKHCCDVNCMSMINLPVMLIYMHSLGQVTSIPVNIIQMLKGYAWWYKYSLLVWVEFPSPNAHLVHAIYIIADTLPE